jgi:hypothetical protein
METNSLDKIREALAVLKTSEVKWDGDKNDVNEDIEYTTVDTSSILGAMGSTSSFSISSLANYSYGNVTINSSGNMGIGASAGNYYYSTGAGSTLGTLTGSAGLHVGSDAVFDGDIKWKGRSLGKLLEGIEDRLAIITEPDPKKLEKFAALKKAYDHYKLMEKLIGDDTDVNP